MFICLINHLQGTILRIPLSYLSRYKIQFLDHRKFLPFLHHTCFGESHKFTSLVNHVQSATLRIALCVHLSKYISDLTYLIMNKFKYHNYGKVHKFISVKI